VTRCSISGTLLPDHRHHGNVDLREDILRHDHDGRTAEDILADNPLRDTVTAEGPLSLESMFEAGNMLIANPPSMVDATRDRLVAGLVSTMAVRDIATAERLEPRPVILVNRPIKPNLRFEPPGGTRTMPLARETMDERRALVITVEKGRRILSGRAATAGRGLPRLLSRSGSLTTGTNITTQIVILPVPKVLATIRE
jgi:hypothetical protein